MWFTFNVFPYVLLRLFLDVLRLFLVSLLIAKVGLLLVLFWLLLSQPPIQVLFSYIICFCNCNTDDFNAFYQLQQSSCFLLWRFLHSSFFRPSTTVPWSITPTAQPQGYLHSLIIDITKPQTDVTRWPRVVTGKRHGVPSSGVAATKVVFVGDVSNVARHPKRFLSFAVISPDNRIIWTHKKSFFFSFLPASNLSRVDRHNFIRSVY